MRMMVDIQGTKSVRLIESVTDLGDGITEVKLVPFVPAKTCTCDPRATQLEITTHSDTTHQMMCANCGFRYDSGVPVGLDL